MPDSNSKPYLNTCKPEFSILTPTQWYSLASLGDYLGELTSELDDGDYITTFVSGDPKNCVSNQER